MDGEPKAQPSNSQPYDSAIAASRSMSGGSSAGGGRVRLAAGSLIAITASSKPPGVQMNSMRQPVSPTM